MCGIFGYVGKKIASPILLEGLRTLEYRGYDSAGVYIPGQVTVKAVGPIDNLAAKFSAAKHPAINVFPEPVGHTTKQNLCLRPAATIFT